MAPSSQELKPPEKPGRFKVNLDRSLERIAQPTGRRAAVRSSREDQERSLGIAAERFEILPVPAKEFRDAVCGAVPGPDPDHLRGMTADQAPLVEVGVLGGDSEPVVEGVAPDVFVVGPGEVDMPDVNRSGVVVIQDAEEPVGEVLVEQEPHAGT